MKQIFRLDFQNQFSKRACGIVVKNIINDQGNVADQRGGTVLGVIILGCLFIAEEQKMDFSCVKLLPVPEIKPANKKSTP